MSEQNLTADERAAVVKLLREMIAADRYPLNRGGLFYGGYRSQPYYPWAPPTGQWQRYGDPYDYGR